MGLKSLHNYGTQVAQSGRKIWELLRQVTMCGSVNPGVGRRITIRRVLDHLDGFKRVVKYDSINRISMGRGKEPMRPPPNGPGQSSRAKEGDIEAQRLAHMEDLELQAALATSTVQFVPNPRRSSRLHINEPAASMPTPSQQNEDNLHGVEDDSEGKKARRRGPSQAQTTSKRRAIDFNERGQPVGPGSDRYVTNLGV